MITCPLHKLEVPCETNYVNGFKYLNVQCPECEKDRKLQELIREKQFQQKSEEALKAVLFEDIPQRFLNAKLSDFGEIPNIEKWVNNPTDFLTVIGPCGTGKSRLACAMAKALRQKKISTKIIYSSELFLTLRNSFSKSNKAEQSELEIVRELFKPEILICDDIGVQKQSEYVIEAWYNLIDYRYKHCKPTVFTSNLQPAELSSCMSDRIASRILSGIVISFVGKDRRLNNFM